MKKIILTALVMCVASFAMITFVSCSKDDGEVDKALLVNGTSWKVTEDTDSSMVGVVLTFMNNGDLKLSKAVDGWNNPKWSLETGDTSSGATIHGLTITMEDETYLYGQFTFIVTTYTSGSATHKSYDKAYYSYGMFDKGQDKYNALVLLHSLTLEKQ